MERKKLPVNARLTEVVNYIEKYSTDFDTLKLFQPIGNSLGIFLGNMMCGGSVAKAKAISDSLTDDIKILLLTEAQTDDVRASFEPILRHFKNPTILTPCDQSANEPNKSAYHLALVDSSTVLNFSLNISTLFISVTAAKDSDDQLSL